MRFMIAHTHGLRSLSLAAAGLVIVACAGSGLAGAFAPKPGDKADSLQSTAASLGLIPTSLNFAAFKSQRVITGDPEMDRIAAQMARLEPASFTTPAASTRKIPVPGRKPDFTVPDTGSLLRYGETPVPKAKPLAHNIAPLSNADTGLYRRIFAAQATGDWDAANEALDRLSDLRLRGHVLFQRYMHPSYKASYAELQSWMALYNDLPGADRIYRLAGLRRAGEGGTLKTPSNQIAIGTGTLTVLSGRGDLYESSRALTPKQQQDIARLVSAVRDDIGHGAPTRALKRLSGDPASKLMDSVQYDQLRSQIASGYLLLGKPDDARILAGASAGRSGAKAPLAGWTGGLAAWRERDYAGAAKLFEQVAMSPYTSSWMNAAGAYWASRSHMRAGHAKDVSLWLREAARHPRTFYGLIATRALGWDFDFDFTAPDFTRADYARLVKIPAAWRAMALVQAGQNHLAEAELLQVEANSDPALKAAMLAYTHQVNLPALAMRLAGNSIRADGKLYDAALYPILPWQPKEGYSVDRALIYAIIRQESKFDTAAESTSGATGLMQLMPATAGYIDGETDFTDRAGLHTLKDPETNLGLGQKYVEQLLAMDDVNHDLMSLAIAYNAGPGNLHKWKQALDDIDDPLLFIEMIPMAETRNYVERVLANYWIYRLRMNQPMPSLDSVAEGKWAMYDAIDDKAQPVRLGMTFASKPFRVADSRE